MNIQQSYYFPFNFRLFGLISFLFCFLLIPSLLALWIKVVLILVFFPLGLVLILWRTGLQINIKEKTYKAYAGALGFRYGQEQTFDQMEKIFVNEVVEQSVFSTRANSTTVRMITYKAFIQFEGGEKVFLIEGKNRDVVESRVSVMREQLGMIRK